MEVKSLKYWLIREAPQHCFSCHYKIYIYIHMSACVLSGFSHGWLFATLWTAAHQTPLSMGFSRHEYWSKLPSPPPGDLPKPGIEPMSLMSPALAGRFLTTSTTWKPISGERTWIKMTEVSFSAHQIGKHFKHGKHPVLISMSISRYSCIMELICFTLFIQRNVTKTLQILNALQVGIDCQNSFPQK